MRKGLLSVAIIIYLISGQAATEEEAEEEPEVEVETEPTGHSSLATMLNEGAEEDYFGYEEDY